MTDQEKVVCRTPTPGKQAKRIDRWKYEAVRRAILEAVPPSGDSGGSGEAGEGLAFAELAGEVGRRLSADERGRLGSVPWYATTVKLDLEVKGEIRRVPGVTPQRLVRG